jgi:hypothetical protein
VLETITITDLEMTDALARIGIRPTVGPLAGIALPSGERRAGASNIEISDEISRMIEIVAAPARIIRTATVTRSIEGIGTTTFAAGPGDGPFIATARSNGGWALASLATSGEVAVVLATHLGLAVPANPASADTIDAEAWSLLGSLADNPGAQSVSDLEGPLSATAGQVVELLRSIGPVRVVYPDDPITAAQRLAIAGVITERSGALSLTEQGAGVVQSLASYALAGSFTVDHIVGSRTSRVAMLSFVRSPDRLFMGVWGLEEGLPVVMLGEPGGVKAIRTVRSLIAALPVPSAAQSVQ